ncbi:MAG: hypothetical protein Fur0010_08230 [Bdellovibrio sp.]
MLGTKIIETTDVIVAAPAPKKKLIQESGLKAKKLVIMLSRNRVNLQSPTANAVLTARTAVDTVRSFHH